jgi:hypothetical protein
MTSTSSSRTLDPEKCERAVGVRSPEPINAEEAAGSGQIRGISGPAYGKVTCGWGY